MPFVRIEAVYTADPADVWSPKSSFISSDPFAVVLQVQTSSDVVAAGLAYDAVFQMVNPREDPYRGSWFTFTNGGVLDMATRDFHWNNVPFQWTSFASWVSWARYSDAVSQIHGSEKLDGVFAVRGTVNVRSSNLFAHSDQFWYKVVQPVR